MNVTYENRKENWWVKNWMLANTTALWGRQVKLRIFEYIDTAQNGVETQIRIPYDLNVLRLKINLWL